MPTAEPHRAESDRNAKRQILKQVFGFDDFRPGQEQAMDALLAGRSVLTVMPTGSGKSLCFQVPALIREGLTIVVSPLVALMQDQVAALHLAGVAADAINSSRDRADNVAAWQRAASGETRLLYMAPERLMTERMLTALGRLNVNLIAIDEAHCISQWGPSFRPEYQDLSRLHEIFPGVPIAALTATADEVTRQDISAQLFAGSAETIVLGFDRPNIKLTVEMKASWKPQLLAFIERHRGASGIVYCLSRKKTEEVAAFLADNGVMARAYHAGMDKSVRDANQNLFMTEPGVVIVATIAFGMGIDKSDVRFVFHADLPGSPEAYYQEIGRAGRDGQPAEAHMLYGLGDIRMRRVFIEQEAAGDERKRREHQRLDALLGYCESPACRRGVLLDYFGEHSEPCGNCDICLDPVDMTDGTGEGQKVLSAIHQTGNRFGAVQIIDVLRGQMTAKVTEAGHDRLAVFATGAEHKKEQWRSIIRQLVAAGFLHLDVKGYGGLEMTAKGQALLRGEEDFQYRQDTMRRAAPSGRKGRQKALVAELSTTEAALLDHLKALRLRLAKERGVPAFVVFSDKSLADMAQRQPQTDAEFAEVNGVGDAKLKEFAAPFLAAIAAQSAPAGDD
ncbi:MAG: DNA helicase RecQ [Alphaproteobacteria bacterium]|nr:DNA helicase RecQ [Alphaproteobacteria bacterium]